jgi:hypothetical protein
MCRFFFGFSTDYKRKYKQHVRLFNRIRGHRVGKEHSEIILPYPFLSVLRENSRLIFDHRIEDEIVQSGVIVYLPARSESSSPIQSIDPAIVDYRKLRQRLDHCMVSHHNCGKIEARPSNLDYLNLIDCVNETIVRAKIDEKYLALSYVWGRSRHQAEQASFSLTRAPLTVRDAIQVVRNLGMRYLWVDRYCINQHTPEKEHMIRNMDEIYENADATIIALYGDNDEAGLPGVSVVPRKPQDRFSVNKGCLLSSCPPISTLIARSKWATRGWTYQEARLSRRCLFFTDHQVYGVCPQTTWSEAIPFGRETGWIAALLNDTRLGATLFEPEASFNLNLPDFVHDRFMYSARALTYESDALNAFRGILSRSPFVTLWGVPVIGRHSKMDPSLGLALGLSWARRPTWTLPRHVSSSERAEHVRRPGFPTWSWTSVTGEIFNEGCEADDPTLWKHLSGFGDARLDHCSHPIFWSLNKPLRDMLGSGTSSMLPEDSSSLMVEGELVYVSWSEETQAYRMYGFSAKAFRPQFDLDDQGEEPTKTQRALKLLDWTEPPRGGKKGKR